MSKALVIKGVDFSTNKLATVTLSENIPCTSVALDQQTKTVSAVPSPFTLTATKTPSNTTDALTWASSNTSVATVSNGVVTPVAPGSATITATCGNKMAQCSVTVTLSYVAVCGYSPFRRSSGGSHATTDKKDVNPCPCYIVAQNKETGLYPIESKPDVNTSPYRFVPIMIPSGATKIKITCSIANFYTRFLYFDSTKKETIANTGAYCVSGLTQGWDQQSSASGSYTTDIPTGISGLDSFCLAIALGGGATGGTNGQDYSSEIGVEFLYD